MISAKSKSYEEQVKLLTEHINEASAIVVGAASGMSAAAGYRHYYERDKDFVEHLGGFEKKYGFHNSFDGFYYRYRTLSVVQGVLGGLRPAGRRPGL